MLISLAWIAELLEGARIDGLADRLADAQGVGRALTGLGLEVEGIDERGAGLEAVRVAEVLSVAAHPNADGLRVVEIEAGTARASVVCGAPNVPQRGGRVAWAPPGTCMPDGRTLEARAIRGVPSAGMLCSETELDLGSDDEGIVILPTHWATGQALTHALPGAHDTVLSLGVTPNRPDALGHLGVARELAALWAAEARDDVPIVLARARDEAASAGLACASDPWSIGGPWRDHGLGQESPAWVRLEAPERCGRYLAVVVDGVVWGPSPLERRVRLHRVGQRAIDRIVDATNWAAMESGQPQHAFDLDRLVGGGVVVRTARTGEPFVALDGSTHTLSDEDLVIADGGQAHAIAGVIGGRHSGVGAQTRRILLEVAWFSPKSVRASARRHGFHTEASHRFERGVDYGRGLEGSMARTLSMLLGDARAAGAQATVIGWQEARGHLPAPVTISLRPHTLTRLLGVSVPGARAESVLRALAVDVVGDPHEGRWTCRVPSHRPDLSLEVDLVEEVMRHVGLDEVPEQPSPLSRASGHLPHDPMRELANHCTLAIAARGFAEHIGSAFSDEAANALAGEIARTRWVEVQNPMRTGQQYLRSHLHAGLGAAVALNHARHDRALALFEVGRVYAWPASGDVVLHAPETAEIDRHLARERTQAGLVLSRPEADAIEAVRALVAVTIDVLAGLGVHVNTLRCTPAASPPPLWAHPGHAARLIDVHGVVMAHVGELHPDVRAALDLRPGRAVAYACIELDAVLPHRLRDAPLGPRFVEPQPRYTPPPRTPGTSRDVSWDLPLSISASEIIAAIEQAAATLDGEVLLAPAADSDQSVTIHEDYRGQGVSEGRRAVLVRIGYRGRHGVITDADAQAAHAEVIERAEHTLSQIAPDAARPRRR